VVALLADAERRRGVLHVFWARENGNVSPVVWIGTETAPGDHGQRTPVVTLDARVTACFFRRGDLPTTRAEEAESTDDFLKLKAESYGLQKVLRYVHDVLKVDVLGTVFGGQGSGVRVRRVRRRFEISRGGGGVGSGTGTGNGTLVVVCPTAELPAVCSRRVV
jgi:hypothetical protein